MQFKNLDVRPIVAVSPKIWMCPFCAVAVNSKNKMHSAVGGGCNSAKLSSGHINVAYIKYNERGEAVGGLADTKTQAELLQHLKDLKEEGKKIE